MDQRNEAVLAPIYGVMVPFHVLTIKGATYSTGDTENAIIRLNFNFGPSWEPGVRHPGAIMLKELSYRCSDTRHAQKARTPDKGLKWFRLEPVPRRKGAPHGRHNACRPVLLLLRHAPSRQGTHPSQCPSMCPGCPLL